MPQQHRGVVRHLHLVANNDQDQPAVAEPITLPYAHAVVWLDHRKATLIGFSVDEAAVLDLDSNVEGRIHTKSGIIGAGRAADDLVFFDDIAAVLAQNRAVLITGPGTAKRAFERHVREKHPELAKRIVGVEALDHPTEGALLHFARQYFKGVDQMGNG